MVTLFLFLLVVLTCLHSTRKENHHCNVTGIHGVPRWQFPVKCVVNRSC